MALRDNNRSVSQGRQHHRTRKVLVVSQPTWGVDAGAATAIHQALIDLADNGAAIIVISQDLDEIFSLADRIAVIAEGKLSQAIPIAEASIEQVGLWMGGTQGVPSGPAGGRHAASA